MVKTVIFDMDGVIIDSEPLHEIAQKKFMQSLGFSITADEKQSFIGTSSKNMWQKLKDQYGLHPSVEKLTEMNLEVYFEVLDQTDIEPIAGVVPLLQSLHRQEIKLILASSSEQKSIDKVLRLFDIEHYFSHKISGASFTHSKPHPEIFLNAVKISESNSATTVVIEDSTNGLKAAKAADIFCFGYDNPNSPGQDMKLANQVLTSFEVQNITEIILRK
ncbi:MAG: HAD family phosphatase [Flavobacteriaceae bacterium]|nr:HAD family phosphatase [Flavobacteriaceae bacterium]